MGDPGKRTKRNTALKEKELSVLNSPETIDRHLEIKMVKNNYGEIKVKTHVAGGQTQFQGDNLCVHFILFHKGNTNSFAL